MSFEQITKDLGERVKALREGQSMSIRELSEKSGRDESLIQKFEESGGNISLGDLVWIAIALNALESFEGLFDPSKIQRSTEECLQFLRDEVEARSNSQTPEQYQSRHPSSSQTRKEEPQLD